MRDPRSSVTAGSTLQARAGLVGAIAHSLRGLGKAGGHFRQGGTGLVGLLQGGQRQSEFQQTVRTLAAVCLISVAGEEGPRGIGITFAHIIGLTEPILRIAGQVAVAVLI